MRQQTAFPEINRWDPLSLALGDASVAVLCAAVRSVSTDQRWDHAAHAALRAGASALADGPPRLGLYDGVAGYGAAVCLLSGSADRYPTLRQQLDALLLPAVERFATSAPPRAPAWPGAGYDLVNGLCGLAAYLLLRQDGRASDPTLAAVTKTLADLLDDLESHRLVLPAGGSAADVDGYVDLGLAHGLPGVVALLSLVLRGGPTDLPAVRRSVRRGAEWIADHLREGAHGPGWPRLVSVNESGWTSADRPAPDAAVAAARPGWCYGTPGVARAIFLAGRALEDQRLQRLAVTAVKAAAHPHAVSQLASATICHGLAGLLLVAAHFAWDTRDPELHQLVTDLFDQLVARYDPDSLLGFVDVEVGGQVVDNPGLLNGAAGVAMCLLACAEPAAPAWTTLFLLA
ncbi:lanthionine synthetase C family protein [Micromonospora eburnea]|uniref:Lanthionine synthetase C-like protein n=1 Tax=Micromonospora eburnea TaxID=227316 RepID=A0A1C6UZ54_9ACTN|nr:lanthionine synthetase C family protein [Micromonospora eburnea]SCL59237.1 Lanthionine synthetase C-like protein [Micromonospora eburnea]